MSKLKLHPKLARVAAKLADSTVQFNKNAVRTFANTRLKTLENFGRHISKEQFMRALPAWAIPVGMKEALTRTIKGGGAAVRSALKNRHRAAKALAEATPTVVTPIHQAVNANGQGFVFRRIRGRIVKLNLRTAPSPKVLARQPAVKAAIKAATNDMNAVKQGFSIEPYFHGTHSAFKKFDLSKIKSSSGAAAQGYGINLAKKPEVASSYAWKAGGNVHKVYVRSGKFLEEFGKPLKTAELKKLMKAAPDNTGLTNFAENPHEAMKAALNAYKKLNPVDQISVISNDFYRGNHAAMGRALKKIGYVGTENKQLGIKVVFNPKDVTSVFKKFKKVKP